MAGGRDDSKDVNPAPAGRHVCTMCGEGTCGGHKIPLEKRVEIREAYQEENDGELPPHLR